jgi:hypothetical protein
MRTSDRPAGMPNATRAQPAGMAAALVTPAAADRQRRTARSGRVLILGLRLGRVPRSSSMSRGSGNAVTCGDLLKLVVEVAGVEPA